MTLEVWQQGSDLDAFARSVIVHADESYRVPPPVRRTARVMKRLSAGAAKRHPAPAEMFGMLAAQLCERVIEPMLVAETRDDCFTMIRKNWGLYADTLGALRVLVGTYGIDAAMPGLQQSDLEDDMRRAARHLAGEVAEDEVVFDSATYQRALRLVPKIPNRPASNIHRDRELAQEFNFHAALYELGMAAVMAAASGAVRATPAGIAMAFELTRGSSLRTYAAVREAIGLRVSPEEPADEGLAPFDEEDAFLAGC